MSKEFDDFATLVEEKRPKPFDDFNALIAEGATNYAMNRLADFDPEQEQQEIKQIVDFSDTHPNLLLSEIEKNYDLVVADPDDIDWSIEPQIQSRSLFVRFGKQIANSFRAIGQTVLSSPLSPFGIPERELQPYMNQAIREMEQSGFKGTPVQRLQMIRNRAAALAAERKVPKFGVTEAEGISEKAVDVAAGVTGFIARLALLRKILPANTSEVAVWEMENQITGGLPGEGAAMAITLGAINKVSAKTLLGKSSKVVAESGIFAGLTAVQGGGVEDILISAAIPPALKATRGFKKALFGAKVYDHYLNQHITAEEHRIKARQSARAEIREALTNKQTNPAQWEAVMRKYSGWATVGQKVNIPPKNIEKLRDFGQYPIAKAIAQPGEAIFDWPIAKRSLVDIMKESQEGVRSVAPEKPELAKAIEKAQQEKLIKKYGFNTDKTGAIIAYHGTDKPIKGQFYADDIRGAFFSSDIEDAFKYGQEAAKRNQEKPDLSTVLVYEVRLRPKHISEIKYDYEGMPIVPEKGDAFITEQAAGDIEILNPNIIEIIREVPVKPEKPEVAEQAPAAPAEAKQPWEMTKEEYIDLRYKESKSPFPKEATAGIEVSSQWHKKHVKTAIEQGKPVPRQILEEYKSEPWAQEALAKMPVEKAKVAEQAPKPSKPAKQGIVEFNEAVPDDVMLILDKRFYQMTGVELPEDFYVGWEGISLRQLLDGFAKLGIDNQILKESNDALLKKGYTRLGNIQFAEGGAQTLFEKSIEMPQVAERAPEAKPMKIPIPPKEERPSSKIAKAPKPGDREAGFVEIPPITTVGKIEAEHPDIIVKKPKKDIGILQRVLLTMTNQAQNSKHPDIIAAAEEMADVGMVIHNDIRSQLIADQHIYKQLPKEYKADNGAKFFELMDKEYTPEQIAADKSIPEEVKSVLRHFKLREEAMRQEIITQKREMIKAVLMRKSKPDLVLEAEQHGLETTYTTQDKHGDEIQKTKTKSMLSEELAEQVYITDDWGRAWSHIQHIFFGQYELSWQEMDPETGETIKHFIGRAETQKEAYQKLADFKAARKEAGFDDANRIALVADPEFHIPFDMLRISRKQFFVLEKQLENAAEVQRQEVAEALRGIVGKRESKQKWWGALMQRKGAPGYSTDFWRVWELESTQFNRWKHLTAMNRKVTPLIEKIRGEGLRGWAAHLEEARDDLWGRKRSETGRELDQYLASIPVVRDHIRPWALERWTGLIKAFNYWRHLQTGRFYALNSLQPMQTLWPVVGEKQLMRGIKLYYSKSGQDVLRKYRIAGISGKLHEFGMPGERRFERYLPAGASEIRNQGLAFLTLYDDAKQRGLSDDDAARYGRLRGQLFTQFTYTRSDIPRTFRGPIGGLIFQYKRFTIKNLELVARLAREGKWSGVSRWIAANLMLGGLRAFTKILPLGVAGFLTYKLFKDIEKEHGKEVAEVIHHGLPALIGIDMSGSIGPFDMPYGENIYESTGRLLFGPTGQTAVEIVSDVMDREVAKELGITGRIKESVINQSPAVKQFKYLIQALQKDTASYNTQQRALYRLETWDLWKKAFGFRPETESEQRMQYEAMLDIKDEYDAVLDHIVLAIVGDDRVEAERLVQEWQAQYPEFPLSPDSIRTRIKEKIKSREFTVTMRGLLRLPKGIRHYFKDAYEEEKKYRAEHKQPAQKE